MQSGLRGTRKVENKNVHELGMWYNIVTNCNGDTACYDDMASETQWRRAVSGAGQVCMPPADRSSDRTPGHSHCERIPTFQDAPKCLSATATNLDSLQLISNFQVFWRCDTVPLSEYSGRFVFTVKESRKASSFTALLLRWRRNDTSQISVT